MSLHGSVPNVQAVVNATKPSIVTASPTTGTTVTLPDQTQDMTAYITPAGTLVALTIALPSDAVTVVGQIIRVFITQAITTLTLASIAPALASVALNGSFTLQKVAANTWIRL